VGFRVRRAATFSCFFRFLPDVEVIANFPRHGRVRSDGDKGSEAAAAAFDSGPMGRLDGPLPSSAGEILFQSSLEKILQERQPMLAVGWKSRATHGASPIVEIAVIEHRRCGYPVAFRNTNGAAWRQGNGQTVMPVFPRNALSLLTFSNSCEPPFGVAGTDYSLELPRADGRPWTLAPRRLAKPGCTGPVSEAGPTDARLTALEFCGLAWKRPALPPVVVNVVNGVGEFCRSRRW